MAVLGWWGQQQQRQTKQKITQRMQTEDGNAGKIHNSKLEG